ncbi:MBL fold metallo-hydrolase [Embleya sp. NBC_00888]|uniref:MBL fold metallo-hydrolase n=1 Tax=Embleya sp. NBC_00888 TaxID=2975960 RepID=UPI0038647DDA|nr:MBL fold metallo-hydrolase [Embleya sp. NBC_00888]
MAGHFLTSLAPAAFGARPAGERLARIQGSPHFRDGAFRNPVPTRRGSPGAIGKMLRAQKAAAGLRRPAGAIPLVTPSALDFARTPMTGLRACWLGHATVLVEMDGVRVLFDPVWSTRCSPSAAFGPARLHAVPVRFADLPEVDVVVVSHDHYDHLDMATIRALAGRDTAFVVPLGIGAHLERWGVGAERITELDWHEAGEVAGLTFTATPARHYCNRGARVLGTVLWASWVVAGPRHRVFHSGDSGYFPGFAEIGREHGPFDLTMIQAGAYAEAWPEVHLHPEGAVQAHAELGGGLMLPIHWGTFDLAPHAWEEPAERSAVAARALGTDLVIPRPGALFEPALVDGAEVEPWWREVAAAPNRWAGDVATEPAASVRAVPAA